MKRVSQSILITEELKRLKSLNNDSHLLCEERDVSVCFMQSLLEFPPAVLARVLVLEQRPDIWSCLVWLHLIMFSYPVFLLFILLF